MSSFASRFGNWLYHAGNAVEAKLYGFTANDFLLDGIEHKVWLGGEQNKPALLLIHGFSASHSVWLRFARFFTKDYHVIIPDLAGHGMSAFSYDDDYSIASQANRMSLLLRALGHSQAHIAGNSMGGFISAHMARHQAEMCLSSILIDPAGVVSPKPSPMVSMLMQGKNPFMMDSRSDFDRFYGMVMAKPPFMPGVVLTGISEHYIERKQELGKIFGDYNQQHAYLDDELQDIDCPSLLLWGAQDELIDVSSTQVWEAGMKCAVTVWPDLGHMPMIEDPKRTANRVTEFLQSLHHTT